MIAYFFFRAFVLILSLIPFGLIYVLSDFLSFILYRVIKYRLDVVESNLQKSNLILDEQKKKVLKKKIYQNLSDLILEAMKSFSMSPSEIIKRHKIINPEVLDPYFQKGQSIIFVASHYGNFEWGTRSISLQLKHKIVGIYKPLKNKWIDHQIFRNRATDKTILIKPENAWEAFEDPKYHPASYALIFDQNPSNLKNAFWLEFLGRPTAVIHGPEKYARKYNLPVFYAQVVRTKRGYYEGKLILIADRPKEMQSGEISYRLIKVLENSIRQEPANWLWTHKRWKHELAPEMKDKLLKFENQ